MTDLDGLEADLIIIQNELLPDARSQLAWLTSPDYKPEENDDHDLRSQDIEDLQREIAKVEAKEQYLIKKLVMEGSQDGF